MKTIQRGLATTMKVAEAMNAIQPTGGTGGEPPRRPILSKQKVNFHYAELPINKRARRVWFADEECHRIHDHRNGVALSMSGTTDL